MTWFHANDTRCRECGDTTVIRRDRLGDHGVVESRFICRHCKPNACFDNECVGCGKWIVASTRMCAHCKAAWGVLASCNTEGWSDQGEACLSLFEDFIERQKLSPGHLFNEFVNGIRSHWRNSDGSDMEMPSVCDLMARDIRATDSLSYAIESVDTALKELGYPIEDLEPDADRHLEAAYMLSMLKDVAERLEAIKAHAKRNYFWLDDEEEGDE